MDFHYPKNEKLKSRKLINLLFAEGKSVTKYPLRLVYLQTDFGEPGQLKISVSVSKKYFKKATDRNYFKRVLRETYRLNKHLLADSIDKPYALMLLYQSKDRLDYQDINAKTVLLFGKFIAAIRENDPKPQPES